MLDVQEIERLVDVVVGPDEACFCGGVPMRPGGHGYDRDRGMAFTHRADETEAVESGSVGHRQQHISRAFGEELECISIIRSHGNSVRRRAERFGENISGGGIVVDDEHHPTSGLTHDIESIPAGAPVSREKAGRNGSSRLGASCFTLRTLCG